MRLAGLRGSFLRFPPIEATKPEVPRQWGGAREARTVDCKLTSTKSPVKHSQFSGRFNGGFNEPRNLSPQINLPTPVRLPGVAAHSMIIEYETKFIKQNCEKIVG